MSASRPSERRKNLTPPFPRAIRPRLEALEGRETPAPVAGTISTIAGSQVGDGLPATAALLRDPVGVAVDSAGDIYIADPTSDRVRRVDSKTGVISTVAGTGQAGYFGDGGPAAAAVLYNPKAVALDAAGDLFIADSGNNRVRRVDAKTGVITTVAGVGGGRFSGDGGPAVAAALSSPTAVAVDAAGDVFVADTGNARVRRVDARTGVITTVAGTGGGGATGDGGPATAAGIGFPSGVAVDAAGDVFVSDANNNRVRRIDGASGIISTFAGNGLYGAMGLGGPATASAIYPPQGLAVDAAGNVFIATGNYVLKVGAADGIISNVAGDGVYGFSGDGGPALSASLGYAVGVAVDPAGNLFIADGSNNRVRRVDAASGIITTVAGDSGQRLTGNGQPAAATLLNSPSAAVVDAAGNVFVADTNNSIVQKVDAKTGIITTVAGTGTDGGSGDGGPATAAELSLPTAVAVDAAGDVYIADTGNDDVRRVDAKTGVITTVAGIGIPGYGGDGGPAAAAALYTPTGVAVDAHGNVFIADGGNYAIRRVDGATGVITTVAGTGTNGYSGDGGPATAAELGGASGVAVDAAGDLFITGGATSIYTPPYYGPGFPGPVSPPTINYTYSSNGNSVRKVDAKTGIITTIAGTTTPGTSGDGGPATAAFLSNPRGVAVDAAGDVYVADYGNNRVRRIDGATGVITTVAGNGAFGTAGDGGPATSANLSGPVGVALDPAGNLLIADSGNNVIREVAAASPVVPPPPVPPVGTREFAVGADTGGAVTVYNPDGSVAYTATPFPGFTGGVRVAMADVTGDGIPDLVAGTGPGVAAQVVVLDGKTHQPIVTLTPFEPSFTGGVFVAAGDLTRDGVPDLVVTPDQTGGPVVVVYDGAALGKGQVAQVARFYGIDDPNFRGGARAAVGDLNGASNLVVAAGFGGGPRVAVFAGASLASGTPARVVPDFYAFEPTLRNGAYVAAGDLTGARTADLIFGAGPGGGPRVRVVSLLQLVAAAGAFTTLDDPAVQSAQVASFYAVGSATAQGGVSVAAKDLTGDGRAGIVTGAGGGAVSLGEPARQPQIGSDSAGPVAGYTGAAILASGSAPTPDFTLDPFPGFAGAVFVG